MTEDPRISILLELVGNLLTTQQSMLGRELARLQQHADERRQDRERLLLVEQMIAELVTESTR